MENYTVTTDNTPIQIGATGLQELLQNVRTILTTVIGSVPLDRSLGMDLSSLDHPTTFTKVELAPVIIEAIQEYEPRVEVVQVDYKESAQGTLSPIVTIQLAEGVTL